MTYSVMASYVVYLGSSHTYLCVKALTWIKEFSRRHCFWSKKGHILYAPSFVRTVPGTAGTSGRWGAGHILLHCEPYPALKREPKAKRNIHFQEFVIIIDLRGLLLFNLWMIHTPSFLGYSQGPKLSLFLPSTTAGHWTLSCPLNVFLINSFQK